MYSINQYLKDTFHCKVYKIALNAGCTCPNRDGTVGVGGCIFCSKNGSGDFAGSMQQSISEQLQIGKQKIRSKIPQGKFIAYFQAFSNTYASAEYLRPKFEEAISDEDVVALSIATRPDCLPNDIMELLVSLNRQKPVWIELGLQTIHERTAAYINRGYSLNVYDEAILKLKNNHIKVIVHVILGLPFETKQDMIQTVQYVADSKADGIKLQLLHVLKDTELEEEYRKGVFKVLSEEEYIAILISCLKCIPEDMVIHRLTGDGKKSELVAPMWSTDKWRVLNDIKAAIRANFI